MLNALFGPDSRQRTLPSQARSNHGTFTGSITTSDLLIIGEHAKIAADISCGSAVVSGEVTGNIRARDSVALQGHARVKGDITTPTFAMDKGAMFDGVSTMQTTPADFANQRARPRNR